MSKAVLKSELKKAESSAKDKELQVIYEELEAICKASEEWEKADDSTVLDSKKAEELDKRYEALVKYVGENFSEEYLKKSKVRPGPLAEQFYGDDIVTLAHEYQTLNNLKYFRNALVEPLTTNPLLRAYDMKKQEDQKNFDDFISKNRDRAELSPYTQRLQKMIKERTGR